MLIRVVRPCCRFLAGRLFVPSVVQRPMLLCLVAVLTLIWSKRSPAQQAPPKTDGTATKETATYEGTQGNIVGFKVGVNPWLMQLDPKVVVTFTGTAETDFVQL